MRFILGPLLGYCIRGKKAGANLTAIAVVCFIVLPAITLSQLSISVRREPLSRPPQTSVPRAHRELQDSANQSILRSPVPLRYDRFD